MRLEDFVTIEMKGDVAVLWLDLKTESENIVSPPLIELMGELFTRVEEDAAIKAAVIISKKKNFIAGADIKSFSIEKPGDFRPFQELGHKSLDRLEASKKPVVAAIHGACMGLGLELALACHARIAADHPKTKLAVPEVKLGILPGGGGTQRLPRLVGLQRALDMMLTGRNIYAYPARKMGLVDATTNQRKLLQAAVMMAERMLAGKFKRKHKKPLVSKLLEDNPIGRSVLFSQARKRALRQSQGNYPAIPAILDCVETGYKKGIAAGYEKELEHFERLMLTPESDALRSLFFAMSANKTNPFGEPKQPLGTLGMIGAGFMGAGIAEVSINNGIDVLLKDIKQEVLTEAQQGIWRGLKKKLKRRSITKVEAEATMGRLRPQLTYDQFEHAGIVIEAVLEKMELKKRIIDDIQKHGAADVVIASNTSSLSISEMAAHAKQPGQVVGMHYFSPVPKMPLLEIVRTNHTSDDVLSSCYDFGVRQGKTCIVVKDSPGFYVNRILGPYMNESLVLLDEGVKIEDIDRAMKKQGFPVGPITLFDQVGLDIAAHVVKSSEKIAEGREGMSIHYGVVMMFDAGRLGRKNGKGFYTYDPKTKKRKEPDASAYGYFRGKGDASMPRETIQHRLLMLMLNEAVLCLEESIIEKPLDGDIGAVFGIGFPPFTAGPFRYMDHIGVQEVVSIMQGLAEQYGPRFNPADTLVKMAVNNERFYS